MIQVTQFQIDQARDNISLGITVDTGFNVTALRLWTESTYKNPATVVDLTALLSGATNTEALTITATQAGVGKLDGIYIIEIESNNPADVPGIAATVSLNRYYTTVAGLLCQIDLACLNCNGAFQSALLIDMYVEAMKNSIIQGRFRDAIEFHKKLNIYTTASCDECENIAPVVSTPGNIVSVGVIDCVLNN